MALDVTRIEDDFKKLRKAVKKGAKQSNPKEVHKLRTHIRRFEATMSAFRFDSGRNERRLLDLLAGLRKKAGKIRDMDVLTSDASAIHVDGEEECLIQLLEHLGVQRHRRARRLRRAVKQDWPAIRKKLKKTENRLESFLGTRPQRSRSSSPGAARAQAAASALELSSELAGPLNLNRRNLHPYRLKVKELRYVLQMGGNGSDKEFIHALGESKDAIGEWHDWEDLIAIASEVLDHPNCRLIQRFKLISQEKYDFALSITNKLRSLYLQPHRREGRRPAAAKPSPALAAVKAASAVAA